MQDFAIEYTFTSRRADGNDYTRQATVRAKTAREAMTSARDVGFNRFGETFTENCVDWRDVIE